VKEGGEKKCNGLEERLHSIYQKKPSCLKTAQERKNEGGQEKKKKGTSAGGVYSSLRGDHQKRGVLIIPTRKKGSYHGRRGSFLRSDVMMGGTCSQQGK